MYLSPGALPGLFHGLLSPSSQESLFQFKEEPITLLEFLGDCTGELGPNVSDHLVCGRDTLQLFGDVFSKLAQHNAAMGAVGVWGKMGDHLARKIFRM